MDLDAKTWAEQVKCVAVIGAGTMGEGISQCFAEVGIAVQLCDVSNKALDRCRSQIAANLKLAGEYGLGVHSEDSTLALIRTVCSGDPASAIENADVIVETVPEIPDLKRSIFSSLDRQPDDILLCSNTSSMTMSGITDGMQTAFRTVGVHFFNPAHIIPAVEVHRGKHTGDDAVARISALLRRVRKTPLEIGAELPGFAINRLTGALSREIANLLDEGVVKPKELDEAVRASLGFRLAWVGPMEGADFIGLDTDARVSSAVFGTLSNRTEPSQALIEKVEQGHLGVKSGKGWYDYSNQSREELLERRNRRLLQQLAAWRKEQEK